MTTVSTTPEEKARAEAEVAEIELGEVEHIAGDGQLEKNFDIWGVVGIVYSSIGTPLTLGTYLSTVIGVGGAPFFFYAYLFTGVFSLMTAFCMAEMASAHAHSSALVYWSQLFAPERFGRGLAYTSGIFSCAAWIFGCVATGFFVADLILGLVCMRHPDYVEKDWHIYLVYIAQLLFAAAVNTFGSRLLPLVGRAVNYVFNGGTIFTLIALLARAHPKASAAFAFKDVTNYTGRSNGTVFFLSMLPSLASIALFDGACHMSDEIPNPRKNIPTVIAYGYSGAYLIGLVAIIVYNFCIVNPDNLLAPVGGIPLFQLYVDAYDNKGLSIFSALVVIVGFLLGEVGVLTSASRLVMAFAEFNSIPGHKYIGAVNTKLNAPVWAIVFVSVIMALIGLLLFASSAALNAVSGSYLDCMFVSYLVPFVALVCKKDRYGDTKPLFSLGRFGKPMNIICIVWFMFASAWLCVPSYTPITANGMNYTIVVLFATFMVALVNWLLWARKHFHIETNTKIE